MVLNALNYHCKILIPEYDFQIISILIYSELSIYMTSVTYDLKNAFSRPIDHRIILHHQLTE